MFEHSLSSWGYDLYLTWMSLAPLLLVGAIVSSLLHIFLPPHFIRRALSGRGGVLRAVMVGVPLPLCSCSVIPTGLGLKRDGASDGATVGFLISTPQTGVDSILVSASLLGLPFALYKVLAAAFTGLIGGVITGNANAEIELQKNDHSHHHHEKPTTQRGQSKGVKEALDHLNEVLEPIWGWVVIGVIASVVIQRGLPTESLIGETDGSLVLSYGLSLALSIPLYICATASVPIAAALVAKGLPVGVALIFLMAGPATNVATLGAVYRGLGRRAFTIYLSTIILGSIAFALVLDLGLAWHAPESVLIKPHDHQHFALWESIGALITLVLFVKYAFSWLKHTWISRKAHQETEDGQAKHVELGVSGLTCQGCVRRLEGNLLAREDIDSCAVNANLDRLQVRGDIEMNQLKQAIRDSGFEPQEL